MKTKVQYLDAIVFFSKSGKIRKAHSYKIELIYLRNDADGDYTKCRIHIVDPFKIAKHVAKVEEVQVYDGVSFYLDEKFKEIHPDLTRITYRYRDDEKDKFVLLDETPNLYTFDNLLKDNLTGPPTIEEILPGLKK